MANEFVTRKGLISLGGVSFPYTSKTSDYIITSEDYFVDCSGTFSVTLPVSDDTTTGRLYIIKNSGLGSVSVIATASQTIDGDSVKLLTQYQSLQLQSSGNSWLAVLPTNQTIVAANLAGNGLTSSGDTLNVNLQINSGLTFSGDNVTLDINTDGLEVLNGELNLKTTISGSRTFLSTVTFDGLNTIMNGGLAQGLSTTVNAPYGFASGEITQVDGNAAAAFGLASIASGSYSFAAGESTISFLDSQMAIGKFNSLTNSTDLFVIGNGTDNSNRSDLAKFATNSILFNSSLQVDSLDLATGSVTSTKEGRFRWDVNNKTVSLGLAGGNVNLQLGQEEFYLVSNQTGATLSNGKVVSAYGVSASGDSISAGYFISNGTIIGEAFLGVVTQDIPPFEKGFVTQFGLVRGIDTTGSEYSETWQEGDFLYASSTSLGGLTNVRPTSPNIAVLTAIVISATTSGSIFVRPTFSGQLNDLDDVEFYGVTPSSESTLQYSSTASLWTWREKNYGAYSAGIITGATAWSQSNNGTITLPEVTVALYDNSNFATPLRLYTVSGTVSGTGTTPDLVDEDTNFIFIEYNNGSPRWNIDQAGTSINGSNVIRFMNVYRAGNFIHNLEFGNTGVGLAEKINARIIQTERFARESGLTIGLSGSTGILTLSEGVAWNGPFRQELAAVNSADDFLFKNYRVGGSWTYSVATPFTFATASDLINNEFYDDGVNRVSASASKYLVNWYYRGQEVNDHLYEVLGNSQFDTFGDAEVSGEPSIPELVQSHAILVGRVIVQVGTFSGVAQSSFGTVFQASSVTSHNDLSGIQGGAANDYYHLTLLQRDSLAFDNLDNQFSTDQTINGYTLQTSTWTESNILITTTNSVIGSGFTFSDLATSSQTVWSAEKVYNYSNRSTIDGSKTFSGDILIQGTLSVLDAFTAGTQFYVNRTILPSLDSTYDLGSSSLMWNKLYVASQSIYVGGVTISSNNDAIAINKLNLGTEQSPTILSASGSDIFINGSIFSAGDTKTIIVAKDGSEFTSVKSAVDSITDATASNIYTVKVRSGVYYEEPFIIPSYVAVVGESSISTIIEATFSTQTLITLSDQSAIFDVQIQGCTGTGVAAVVYSSTTTPQTNAIAYVENVRFGTNYTHAKVIGTASGNCIMQCSNVKYGGYPFTIGFQATNDGSGVGRMQLRNVTSTNGGITNTSGLIFAKADATGCGFIVNGCLLTRSVGAAAGIGFQVENGGFLRLTGVNFQRWSKAIYVPAGAGSPSIDAIALNFENNTTDVEILNNSTTGKIQGVDNYSKTIISSTASLYVVNKDQRILTVAKKGGDFNTIGQAVASITDSSDINRYTIEVGPGVFRENLIDLSTKPYVSIVGSNIQTTQIFASASNHNLFNMGIFNEISFLSINGVGTGYAAIVASNSGDFSQAHKLSFYDCDTGINIFSSTSETQFYGEYIDFNGTFSNAVCVTSENNQVAFANVENFYCYPSATGSMAACVYNEGAELDVTVSTLEGVGNDTAFYLENGGNLKVAATDVIGYENGIWIPNTGTGSTFNFSSAVIEQTVTNPIKNENTLTKGFFQGSIYDHNTIINNSIDIYWQFIDTLDGELNITRKLSITFEDGTTTDVSTLVFETGPMGVIEGGILSTFSGLTISISSGYGYLEVPSTEIYKRIDWSTSQLLLTDNSPNYIYINDSEVFVPSGSFPSTITTIFLGRVVTENGQVLFIDNTRIDTKHADNKLNLFNRKALGAVYENGSIVTVGNTSSSIDVTGGSYWYGDANFLPSGGFTVSLTDFYRDGLGDWIISLTNSITSQYDAGSGSLITMSASYYTKHTLYVVGQGVDEKYLLVIGQTQYQNLVDAESAGLSTPPTYFEDGVVSIAAIYVQEGYNGIYQIEDIRPILGFKSSGVNASSDHGNLIGLGDDDHLQYLLVNGARSMSGNLLMGSNSISGVTTVNGVVVESHASRHLPNGADPLTTATPVTIGTVSSEGNANSFARSNHVHAHGDQPGGSLHSLVTTSDSGFMSASDKVIFDAIPSTYVNVTGDTMTGLLTMSSNKITELATGSNNLDAVNYGQLVKKGAFDNFIYVSDYTDFGLSSSSAYTLQDNKTYFITTTIDLFGGRLIGGQNTTILGGSSENCRIKSTGLTSGVPLLTSSYSIPMRGLTLESNTVFLLDAGSPSTNQAIDWFGVNVSSPDMGTISNYTNFIASDCAFLESDGLVFDGTMGTIGFSQTLFTNFSGGTVITLPSTLTITRRFRTIYSSFVVTGVGIGIDASTLSTIPNESYILDSVNFSGGGNYITGITATNSNDSLFINCVGIRNTSTNGYMYFQNNTTDTTIVVNTWTKAAGTSTALDTNSKFDHTSNRLTYTGAFSQTFLVSCNASVRTSNTNQNISIGIAKNNNLFGATVSEVTIRTAVANQQYPGSTQLVVSLEPNDFVELWVKNINTVNVRVEDMNFVVSKIGS